MKSKVIKNRHLIECACGDPNQLLVFDFYEYEEDCLMEIYVMANWHLNVWQRIKSALKYIWKKESFIYADVIMLNSSNIQQLEEWINFIKEKNNIGELNADHKDSV
jgi:hypothetical protein